MTLSLALYQPDIPQNTGTLIRLGACLGVAIHIIHPTGFVFGTRTLKRAGLDYLDHAEVIEHISYTEFDSWRRSQNRRLALLTTRASTSAYDASFEASDILMVGRESAGVPQAVADSADLLLRIPMRDNLRSLNVAIAASLVLGEALRQTRHFETLA